MASACRSATVRLNLAILPTTCLPLRCLERTCPCLKDRAVAEFQTLKIESLSSHLALLTLNRPEAANALNTQMGRDLMDYFEGVALSSQNLRCIIVSGSGSKVFC